jgi:hypothetical protein
MDRQAVFCKRRREKDVRKSESYKKSRANQFPFSLVFDAPPPFFFTQNAGRGRRMVDDNNDVGTGAINLGRTMNADEQRKRTNNESGRTTKADERKRTNESGRTKADEQRKQTNNESAPKRQQGSIDTHHER